MVYIFHHHIIEDSNQKLLDFIFDSFPATIRSSILKYKKQEDRNRAIAGKALLVEAMKILEIDHDLNEIKYSLYQRPHFSDLFDFNISHSHDFVVCAISKKNCVGIDIEKIRSVDLNDLKYGFSDKDWEQVISSDDQLKRFYTLWTKRESFLKAIGTGLTQLTEEVNFKRSPIVWNKIKWSIVKIKLHEEYICHLTVDHPKPTIELRQVKFNKFC